MCLQALINSNFADDGPTMSIASIRQCARRHQKTDAHRLGVPSRHRALSVPVDMVLRERTVVSSVASGLTRKIRAPCDRPVTACVGMFGWPQRVSQLRDSRFRT